MLKNIELSEKMFYSSVIGLFHNAFECVFSESGKFIYQFRYANI